MFHVVDDVSAEKLIVDLREKREESQRVKELCRKMISEYQSKIDIENEKLQEYEVLVEGVLKNYMTTSCEVKETDTQYSYKLASAKLVYKKPKSKIVMKEDLIEHIDKQFIQVETKEKLLWGEFKKTLEIKDGVVVNQDGEIVEGVEIEVEEEKFKIV